MATQAYKDKRIATAKTARQKAKESKSKAEKAIAEADATITQIDQTLAWLESMPVEDATEEGEPDGGES